MSYYHGDLGAALCDLGNKKPIIDNIAPDILAKLIEIKVVQRTPTGLPILTDYGHKCYEILESGNEVYVPELDVPQAVVGRT